MGAAAVVNEAEERRLRQKVMSYLQRARTQLEIARSLTTDLPAGSLCAEGSSGPHQVDLAFDLVLDAIATVSASKPIGTRGG